MKVLDEVKAYQIRALGVSLDWDCSVGQIADDLGIAPRAVERICKVKGWRPRREPEDASPGAMPIDLAITSNWHGARA